MRKRGAGSLLSSLDSFERVVSFMILYATTYDDLCLLCLLSRCRALCKRFQRHIPDTIVVRAKKANMHAQFKQILCKVHEERAVCESIARSVPTALSSGVVIRFKPLELPSCDHFDFDPLSFPFFLAIRHDVYFPYFAIRIRPWSFNCIKYRV